MWPSVPDSTYIFHGAQVVGDVTLGEHVSIWHNCVLRGDVNSIVVGERSNIQDGTVIHVSTRTYPTTIGRDCLVAHMVMLHGCTLKDRAFVGMGAMVMDNCTIEEDGMLAAGAMLTPGKTVGERELWAGRPAKFVRMLTDAELTKNRGMAEHYRLLAEQHKADGLGQLTANPYP
ncbi:MAG: gamma carbonic anhydrase family protein [Alphaproteobacteria bacterium]|nr:MAG: gamma carbonic anhydrase family protein [Alphaproteobacteria bacterium]